MTQSESMPLDSSEIFKKRRNAIWLTGSTTYLSGSAFLYSSWYKNYDQSRFHFYNDWNEWENMDKLGHIQASYFQTDLAFSAFKWAGYDENEALLRSSLVAIGFQSTIEIMDGFSSAWGFSIPDMSANIVGTGLFYLQQKIWHKQHIKVKFSYYPGSIKALSQSEGSDYQTIIDNRETQLYGRSVQQILKNYNNQTIWLSFSPKLIFKEMRWPEFLHFSIGLGAGNMLGGYNNSWTVGASEYNANEFAGPRYRQYIFALDYDLESIKVKTAFGKSLFKLLNVLKWPAPAIELRNDGSLRFHLLFTN